MLSQVEHGSMHHTAIRMQLVYGVLNFMMPKQAADSLIKQIYQTGLRCWCLGMCSAYYAAIMGC